MGCSIGGPRDLQNLKSQEPLSERFDFLVGRWAKVTAIEEVDEDLAISEERGLRYVEW